MNQRFYVTLAIALLFFTNLNAEIYTSSNDSTLDLTGATANITNYTNTKPFYGHIKYGSTGIASKMTTCTISQTDGQVSFFEGDISSLTGTINSAATNKIILSNNQTFNYCGPQLNESISVTGSGNTILLKTILLGGIVLSGAGASASILSHSPLESSITLNGGTLTLLADTTFQQGQGFSGSGTINLNNCQLSLEQQTISSALTIKGPGVVNFTGINTVSALVTLDVSAGAIEISGPGQITIAGANSGFAATGAGRVFFNTVQISGLSTAATRRISASASSEVEFENCALTLAANMTVSAGKFYFTRWNLITCGASSITFSGASTEAFVGRGLLLYERLGQAGGIPLAKASSAQIYLDDYAFVQSTVTTAGAAGVNGVNGSNATAETNSSFGASTTLTRDYNLQSISTITLTNAGGPVTRTLNFAGFSLNFNYSTGQFLNINQNVAARFQNAIINGFSNSKVVFGSGSSLWFLNSTTVNLFGDTSILTTDQPWRIGGNCIIDGNKSSLFVGDSANLITNSTANTSLTLRNLKLKPSNPISIKQNLPSNTIIFQNCDIYVTTTGITLDTGDFKIAGDVRFIASGRTDQTEACPINFTTAGSLTISSGATMTIGDGVIFNYTPNIGGNTTAQAQNHVIMTDQSSKIVLNNGKIFSQTPGMSLYTGILVCQNDSNIQYAAPGAGEAGNLGNNLEIRIAPDAALTITGTVQLLT